MKTRAFTLVEILVAISIIILLSSILTPVLKSTVASAKETQTASNLRQHHLALKMYQIDWNGDGNFGSSEAMAYPLVPYYWYESWPIVLNIPDGLTTSPCGLHPSQGQLMIHYHFRMLVTADEGHAFKDNLLTFADVNCNPSNISYQNTIEQRRGIGILLGGQIVNHRKYGNMWRFDWWASPILD